MGFLIAIALGVATSIWRYIDGSDARPKGSNIIVFVIILAAGVYAVWDGPDLKSAISIAAPILVSGWLMVRGMPGWESLRKMMAGFALPTALATLPSLALQGVSTHQLPFALSGAIVAISYVGLSALEGRYPSFFRSFTAEKYGRLSYGFIVFGLVLLGRG